MMSNRNGDTPFHIRPGNRASQHVEEQLAAFTGGELTQSERLTIERHLAGCASCRAALDDTRRIRALLSSLASAPAPASIADAVLASLPDTPTMQTETDDAARPVLPSASVPLPVSRQAPRIRSGRLPSPWRSWNGATGRNVIAMKHGTQTQTERRTRDMLGADERQPNLRRTGGGRFRSVITLVATVALVALLVGVFAMLRHPEGTASPSGSHSNLQNSQNIQFNLPPNSQLSAISMTSPSDGWAVGVVNNAPNGMGGPKNALLVHFDGHAWTPSPDSANFPLGQLISVSMVSAADGWATGSTQTTPSSPMRGLVLHYFGGHWHAVDLSSLGFAGGGQVSMSPSGDGWLIATVGSKTSPDQKTLALHYHLGKWSLFSSLPGINLVSMLSLTAGWAVNQNSGAILRYQNGAWKSVATTPGQALTLSMASPTDGWIGGANATTQSAFAMHFDGHSWSQSPLPDATHAEIVQMATLDTGDVWILGQAHVNTMAPSAIAWRYSAGHWTRIALGFNAYPTGISMASDTSGWIIGNAASNTAALMRYNHGDWSPVYYGK